MQSSITVCLSNSRINLRQLWQEGRPSLNCLDGEGSSGPSELSSSWIVDVGSSISPASHK